MKQNLGPAAIAAAIVVVLVVIAVLYRTFMAPPTGSGTFQRPNSGAASALSGHGGGAPSGGGAPAGH